MAFWLVKSEPSSWSWDDQVKKGTEHWNGVRNHQASNNMKAMKKGDLAFFYHSGEEKAVVGIVEVAKEYYPDHTDPTGKFGMVDVKTVKPMPKTVSLAAIKAEPALADFILVRHTRLSVVPVTAAQWTLICKMGGVPAK